MKKIIFLILSISLFTKAQDSSFVNFGEIDSTVHVTTNKLVIPIIKSLDWFYGKDQMKFLEGVYSTMSYTVKYTHHQLRDIGNSLELLGQIHPNKIMDKNFQGVYSNTLSNDLNVTIDPGAFSALHNSVSSVKIEKPLEINTTKYFIASDLAKRQLACEGKITENLNSRLILTNTAPIKVIKALEIFPSNFFLMNTNNFSSGEIKISTYLRLGSENGEFNTENLYSGTIRRVKQNSSSLFFASTFLYNLSQNFTSVFGVTFQDFFTNLIIDDLKREVYEGRTKFKRIVWDLNSKLMHRKNLNFQIKTEFSLNEVRNNTLINCIRENKNKNYAQIGMESKLLLYNNYLTEFSINSTLEERFSFALREVINFDLFSTDLELIFGTGQYYNPSKTNTVSAEDLIPASLLNDQLANQDYVSLKFHLPNKIINAVSIEYYKKEIKDLGSATREKQKVRGFNFLIKNNYLRLQYLHGSNEKNGGPLDGAVGRVFKIDGTFNLKKTKCFIEITWADFYYEKVYGFRNFSTKIPSKWNLNLGVSKSFKIAKHNLNLNLTLANLFNREIIRSYRTSQGIGHLYSTTIPNLEINYSF